MADFYLSPNGSDTSTGTLTNPWLTLAKGFGAVAGSTLNLLPGNYTAPAATLTKELTITATAPGVIVEPVFAKHGGWTQVTLSGFQVWKQASTVGVNCKAACWATARDATVHRIPYWSTQAVVTDAPDHWANTVLNVNNPHCRWGLYATATDLYLIPPADGSWTDPNTVWVWASAANGIMIAGNGIQVHGLTLICHVSAIKISVCQGVLIDSCTTRVNKYGTSIFGGLPAVYGSDHVIRNCRWEDDGTSLRPGETQIPHQMESWNEIKHIPIAYGTGNGSGLLNAGEACGGYLEGGASNVLFEDCTSDGTFDAMGHFMVDGRYDVHANSGLIIRRLNATNGADDGIDFSRFGENVTVEDSTFTNQGTVASNAPFYGNMIYKRCTGWNIGDQSRVKDGFGNRPPGLMYKYGFNNVAGTPQGSVGFEDCIFWSDNPTTKGCSPDGGDGPVVPKFSSTRSVWRVGSRVVNYLHPQSNFIDSFNTWSTSTTTTAPVTASFPIALTPASVVDASYYSPSTGDFTSMSVINDLQQQILDRTAERDAALAQLAALQQLVRNRIAAEAAEDAAV